MGKAMDVYMWSLHITGREKVHSAIWQAADQLESEHGIVCRPFRKKDLHAEVARFVKLYNTEELRSRVPSHGRPYGPVARVQRMLTR